jgi:hypothetical protein
MPAHDQEISMTTTRARRLAILLGLTALIAGSLSVAATDSSPEPSADLLEGELFTPAPQPMGGCITCVGNYLTDTHWGMGTSCSEALQDLDSQVKAAARAPCQSMYGFLTAPCNTQLFPIQCWFKAETGQWIYDGYLEYGCLEGDYFCPEW